MYNSIVEGKFIRRPNRFVAEVEIDGRRETVHVKNTGRCKELLLPGATVYLEESDNPSRKTRYDLVVVHKEGLGLVNMDSQAPNKVAGEWLKAQGFSLVKAEYSYGKSRIDFYMEGQPKAEFWREAAFPAHTPADQTEQAAIPRYLMEVKGCTLEIDGVGYFPDAPTERGVKHLQELAAAARQGFRCIAAFVIQMEGIKEVRANVETHPEFGQALQLAREAGVQVLFLCCSVKPDELLIQQALWDDAASHLQCNR